MTWRPFLSSLPLLLPIMCWAAGCSCDWLCPMAGMTGCVALAGLAAAGLFATLTLVREIAALEAIRD